MNTSSVQDRESAFRCVCQAVVVAADPLLGDQDYAEYYDLYGALNKVDKSIAELLIVAPLFEEATNLAAIQSLCKKLKFPENQVKYFREWIYDLEIEKLSKDETTESYVVPEGITSNVEKAFRSHLCWDEPIFTDYLSWRKYELQEATKSLQAYRDDFQEILGRIQRFAACWGLPKEPTTTNEAESLGDRLTDTERLIVQAVKELGPGRVKKAAIAKRLGYSNPTSLDKPLPELVKRGILSSQGGPKGGYLVA